MDETIINLPISLEWFLSVLGIIGTLGLAVYVWGIRDGSTKNRLNAVETGLGKHEKKIAGLEKQISDALDTFIQRLLGILEASKKKGAVAEPGSPLDLNKYGQALSERINGKEIAKLYVARVEAETQDLNPYEMQQYCFQFAQGKLLDDLKANHAGHYRKLSEIAFDEGEHTDRLLRVIGFELRNAILTRRKINPKDIDAHAPDGPLSGEDDPK